MNTQNTETAKPISEMENGTIGESVITRTDDQNSSVVGESAEPKAAGRRNPVKGTLIERKFQRRNNINSLPGLIREHARLIALIRAGEIALDRGEVLSRAYGRHKEMVSALEQRNELAKIREELRAIRGDPSQQFLIDEAKEPKQ
jgi:hypothetical protein